jgi:hypothetical protein
VHVLFLPVPGSVLLISLPATAGSQAATMGTAGACPGTLPARVLAASRCPCLPELPQLIRLKYLTAVNRWTGLPSGAAAVSGATGGDLSPSLMWRELLCRYQVSDIASSVQGPVRLLGIPRPVADPAGAAVPGRGRRVPRPHRRV